MKKYLSLFIIFAITIIIVGLASAEEVKFKDMSDKHWAAASVYDLVKLGVTKGYPDGTFRGTKKINRYETAVFLAKLAKAIGGGSGTGVSRAEIAALKKDIAALKKRPASAGSGLGLSGDYLASWKFGNLLTEVGGTRGAVANYRLKLSTSQDLGEGANIKINLDTMDNGYYSDGTTTGDLATELFDLESNLIVDLAAFGLENPVGLKVTYGPGSKQHTVDLAEPLPSEVGVTYVRPYTGIMAATSLWGMDVSGGYYALAHSTAGRVQTSQITGTVGYKFNDVPVVKTLKLRATGDFISAGMFSSSLKDTRAKIDLTAPLSDKIEASGMIGLGGPEKKNWMVAGEVALNDIWDTGTIANITVSKVGADYITDAFEVELFDVAGLDNFNRPLEEGTLNFGGEVEQTVSDVVKLIGKGDVRLASDGLYDSPKGRFTAEGGVSYTIAPNTTLDAIYRLHQDRATSDTSDVAALGLLYNF